MMDSIQPGGVSVPHWECIVSHQSDGGSLKQETGNEINKWPLAKKKKKWNSLPWGDDSQRLILNTGVVIFIWLLAAVISTSEINLPKFDSLSRCCYSMVQISGEHAFLIVGITTIRWVCWNAESLYKILTGMQLNFPFIYRHMEGGLESSIVWWFPFSKKPDST